MRRLNVKLVIWLSVTSLTLFVLVGVVHAWQMKRTAKVLLAQAQEAEENDELDKAASFLSQYVEYEPDDAEESAHMALTYAKIAEKPGATFNQAKQALGALEATLRRHVDRDDVRRRLVDFTMMVGRAGDATEHIEFLLKATPEDADLLYKLGRCQIMLDKNQEGIETLRRVIKLAPDKVPAYANLATTLRDRLNEKEEADQIIDKMVDLNPEDVRARLNRVEYLRRYYRPSEGIDISQQVEQRKADLKKALALDPDDAEVLLLSAAVALEEGKKEEARHHLEHGVAVHPDNERIIEVLVQLDRMEGNLDGSAARLAQGPKSANLQLLDFDIKVQQQDLAAARKILAEMEKDREIQPAVKEYLHARLDFHDHQWLKASKELERLRPTFPNMHLQIDLMLGRCFEMLGEVDRQVESFQRAATENPTSLPAHVGLAGALMIVGQHERALAELELVKRGQGLDQFVQSSSARAALVGLLMQRNSRLPEKERDWREIDEIVAATASAFPGSKELLLLEASVSEQKGDRAAARLMLESAADKDPKTDSTPWLSLARLSFLEDGAEAALKTLSEAEKKIGDNYMLRSARISYATQLPAEEGKAEIAKAAEKLEQFGEEEQERLLRMLGVAYYRANDMEKARNVWTKVAEKKASDPSAQFMLLEIAFNEKNDAAIGRAIDSVKRLFGAGSPEAKYVDARRLVGQVRAQKSGDAKAALAEARQLIHRATEQRPGWATLAHFEGDIDVLDGRIDEAISDYVRAYELGDTAVGTAREIARLMLLRGRGADAKQYMDIAATGRESADSGASETLEISLALSENDIPKAVKLLERAREKDPNDPQKTVTLGQLLPQLGREQEAEALLRELVDKQPEFALGLFELVRFLRQQRRDGDARQVITDAQEKLPKDQADVIVGQCYDLLDDKEGAEKYFLKALAANPNDLGMARALATFYLREKQTDKARELLNKLLSAKPSNDSEKEHVAWANRELAMLIAGSGIYRDFQEGLKRLKSQGGKASSSFADRVAMAQMLANRPEAESRLEAIKLLEEIKRETSLQPDAQVILARLYELTGSWPKCRDEMLSVLGRAKDNPKYIGAFIEMLLRNDDPDAAAFWLTNLEKVAPEASLTTALKARLLVKQGKADEGVALLRGLLPRPMPREKLRTLVEVAGLLEQLEQIDAAESMYREYVALEPNEMLVLAGFIARNGKLKDSLDICQKALDSRFVGDVIRKSLDALRLHQGDATKEDYARVEAWITKAIARAPKDLILQLDYSEFLDLQGRTAEVEEMYRKLLKNPDVVGYQRALVLNNLAYQLAVHNKPGDARKFIDEAIEILGPTSDLLDTRALVRLSSGEAKPAVEDLQRAVIDQPTGTKYFHLAQACVAANDTQGAQDAMKKAVTNYNLKVDDLPRVEQSTFKQLSANLLGK